MCGLNHVSGFHIFSIMAEIKEGIKAASAKNQRKQFQAFSAALLVWNAEKNDRPMPWKGETDPYKIWLSEIMLQQTRVEQGWNYYLRFLKQYPTVAALAAAPPEDVFKLWEGLGYYSRCRNLLAAAQQIMTTYNGKFPADYNQIIQLKGVGPYTAAAIASFAFAQPYAVVDGNVIRILARYFGITTPFDTAKGKKLFSGLAQQLLDAKQPGLYNQTIMDFGATVCKPSAPLCSSCPLQATCFAFNNNQFLTLPAKQKKLIKRNRWLYYAIIKSPKGILVGERNEKDIWKHLFHFPLREQTDATDFSKAWWEAWCKNTLGLKANCQHISQPYKQQLTHQTIQAVFIHFETTGKKTPTNFEWAEAQRLQALPFPQIIRQHFFGK